MATYTPKVHNILLSPRDNLADAVKSREAYTRSRYSPGDVTYTKTKSEAIKHLKSVKHKTQIKL